MTRRSPAFRRRATLLAALLLLFAFPVSVEAHAALDVATPKDGATVQGTPTEISGTYVQDLGDGSSLRLLDASDTVIARGIIDPDDDRRMFIAEIPALAPGTYTVRSTTVSAEDGETDRAIWMFTVEAALTPAPTPSPTPAPSASDTPSGSPTTAPSATPSPTVSPAPSQSASGDGAGNASGDVILPIVAAVGILALGAVWFTRRGRATPGR